MSASTPSDPPTDHHLVGLINGGSDAAFEQLYHRHRDWVFRMACRITGDSHLAEDVVQDLFCYLIGKFPGFELRCELRTFLYPAIRNLSLTAVKKSRRLAGGIVGEDHLRILEAPATDEGSTTDFISLISNLSLEHREALLLRFVDGMKMSEIAGMLNIPVGTVKSRLHHALTLLRKRHTNTSREIL